LWCQDKLDDLKSDGVLKLWGDTIIEPSQISSKELQLFTRSSFSSADYFQDIIIRGAQLKNPENYDIDQPQLKFFITVSIIFEKL